MHRFGCVCVFVCVLVCVFVSVCLCVRVLQCLHHIYCGKQQHMYLTSSLFHRYTASDQVSFDHIEDWLTQASPKKNTELFLIANKSDLPPGSRSVGDADAMAFAELQGMTFLKTR